MATNLKMFLCMVLGLMLSSSLYIMIFFLHNTVDGYLFGGDLMGFDFGSLSFGCKFFYP